MKYIYVYLFLNLAYSQKNIEFIAEYNVTTNIETKKEKISEFEKNKNLALNNAKSLNFKLLFKKNKSHFFADPILEKDLDKNKLKLAKLFCGYTGDIYIDFENDHKYKVYDNNLGVYTIRSKTDSLVWNISTEESKKINNFLCYKATTKEKIVNNYGVFYNEIEAWFSPDIPVSEGPLGFNGLPGLIFELQRKGVVFGLTSIQINPKVPVEIEFPDKNTIKTEEEVIKMKEDFLLND